MKVGSVRKLPEIYKTETYATKIAENEESDYSVPVKMDTRIVAKARPGMPFDDVMVFFI